MPAATAKNVQINGKFQNCKQKLSKRTRIQDSLRTLLVEDVPGKNRIGKTEGFEESEYAGNGEEALNTEEKVESFKVVVPAMVVGQCPNSKTISFSTNDFFSGI